MNYIEAFELQSDIDKKIIEIETLIKLSRVPKRHRSEITPILGMEYLNTVSNEGLVDTIKKGIDYIFEKIKALFNFILEKLRKPYKKMKIILFGGYKNLETGEIFETRKEAEHDAVQNSKTIYAETKLTGFIPIEFIFDRYDFYHHLNMLLVDQIKFAVANGSEILLHSSDVIDLLKHKVSKNELDKIGIEIRENNHIHAKPFYVDHKFKLNGYETVETLQKIVDDINLYVKNEGKFETLKRDMYNGANSSSKLIYSLEQHIPHTSTSIMLPEDKERTDLFFNMLKVLNVYSYNLMVISKDAIKITDSLIIVANSVGKIVKTQKLHPPLEKP